MSDRPTTSFLLTHIESFEGEAQACKVKDSIKWTAKFIESEAVFHPQKSSKPPRVAILDDESKQKTRSKIEGYLDKVQKQETTNREKTMSLKKKIIS